MLLKAVSHLELRYFTHKARLLILNETLCILDELTLTVEIHETDKLLLLITYASTLINHPHQVLISLLILRGKVSEFTLQKVTVHHHHVRMEIFSLKLELLRGNLLSLFNCEIIELLISEVSRFILHIDFKIILFLLLCLLDNWLRIRLNILFLSHYVLCILSWLATTH